MSELEEADEEEEEAAEKKEEHFGRRRVQRRAKSTKMRLRETNRLLSLRSARNELANTMS